MRKYEKCPVLVLICTCHPLLLTRGKPPMTTRDPSPFFEMQDIKKKAEGKKEIVDLRPLNGGFKIFNQGEPPHDGDQASEEVFACDEQSNHQMTLLTIYI